MAGHVGQRGRLAQRRVGERIGAGARRRQTEQVVDRIGRAGTATRSWPIGNQRAGAATAHFQAEIASAATTAQRTREIVGARWADRIGGKRIPVVGNATGHRGRRRWRRHRRRSTRCRRLRRLAEAGRVGARQEGFRWTAGDGRRRAWKILAEPLFSGGAAGPGGPVLVFAIDMTEAEETRDTLRRHVTAHDETLNHLADAVAIFGPSKRLAFHNTAFQTLFNIDPAWLDERPTHAELLDRLRQKRQLPEVIDYAGWKANELEFYGAAEAAPDDSWSLPDGRTLRVVRQPHPLGGILLLFSDITDELQLRSRFNAQIQVQTATLDKLNDAVAVFGSDGRLRLHNEAFEAFWSLTNDQLVEAGDFDAVERTSSAEIVRGEDRCRSWVEAEKFVGAVVSAGFAEVARRDIDVGVEPELAHRCFVALNASGGTGAGGICWSCPPALGSCWAVAL